MILGEGVAHPQLGMPFAVCGKIDIPWYQGTDWHTLRLELVDGDGEQVVVPKDGSDEPEPLVIEYPPFRQTIGSHVKAGTSLDWPFAMNIGPGLPLKPGSVYEWRISINGKTDERWRLPFSTTPMPLASAA